MLGFALSLAVLVLPPQPPDSAALIAAYRQAVANMGPSPQYVSFHESVRSDDVDVRMFRDDAGVIHTGMVVGRANGGREAVDVNYREQDALASLHLSDGSAGLSHSPFYDPTWPGMRAVAPLWFSRRSGRCSGRHGGSRTAGRAAGAGLGEGIYGRILSLGGRGRHEVPERCARARDSHDGVYRSRRASAQRRCDRHLDFALLQHALSLVCSGPSQLQRLRRTPFPRRRTVYLATAGSVEGDVNDVTLGETRHARIEFDRSAFAFPPALTASTFVQTEASR